MLYNPTVGRGGEEGREANTDLVEKSNEGLILPGLKLSVMDGTDIGKSVTTVDSLVRIGSAPDNQLVLTDSTVSRYHCEVRMNANGVAICDLGSTNGTTVDGVPVVEAFLRPASMIQVGKTTLRCTAQDEEVGLPLSRRDHFGRLIGKSPMMRHVFAVLERVAPTEATVLIEGETGTGKELAAEGLHAKSRRTEGPFLAVDCGAIAANLIESELFGHVKGSFTGAAGDRVGAFEEANGGTVFLDEIGELPLELQPKLLRVLESKEVRRVGSNKAQKINARVIAATNRDLRAEVNRGTFREDLYFRLAVVRVTLPPLRARRDDIPLLVKHLFRALAPTLPLPSEQVMESLTSRSWPGNVRELRNAVERAIALAHPAGPVSLLEDKGAPGQISRVLAPLLDMPRKEASEKWQEIFERAYLGRLLNKQGSVSAAAREIGLSRRQLQRLMKRFGLRDESGAQPGDDDARG